MITRLTREYAKKGATVQLSQDLPTERNFGNRFVISEGKKGYITNDFSEGSLLKVRFPLHHGDENTQFNELSATQFLLIDVAF